MPNLNGALQIRGENRSSITAMSGDIKLYNSNRGHIKVMRGDASIDGGNYGTIFNHAGDIQVRGINEGQLDSIAGDISVSLDNKGKVTNLNGRIVINGSNYNGVISNGDIEINGQNFGGVMLVGGGNVLLSNDQLRIHREIVSRNGSVINQTGVNIGNVFSGRGQTIINGKVYSDIRGGNINIINGEVYVNGRRVDPDGTSETSNTKSFNKVTINGELEIDYVNHTVKLRGNDASFKGERVQVGEYMLRADQKNPENVFVIYRQQIILVRKDDLRIANQSYFRNMGDDFSFGEQEKAIGNMNAIGNMKLLR